MLEAFHRYTTTGGAGDFTDALHQFMGDYTLASDETRDAIIALKDYQGPTKPTERHGKWGIHSEDEAIDIQNTLAAYMKACNGLFRDYGIDLSQPFSVVLGEGRQVHVEGDHPDAQKIEELLNGSFLLRNTANMLLGKAGMLEAQKRLTEGSGEFIQPTDLRMLFQAGEGGWSASIYLQRQALYTTRKQEELEAEANDQQLQEVREAEEAYLRQKQQQEEWLKEKLLRDEAAEKAVEKALAAAEAAQVQPTYI
jgi:hypothetical protein